MNQKQIITTRTRLNLTTCLYLSPSNRARSLSTLRDLARSRGIHQSKSRLKDYKIREHSKRPSPLSLLSKIGGTLQRVVEQEVQHKHLRSPDTERESNFTTVFVDTLLSKTKRPWKLFQNFRQSYMLSTDRIAIHHSQPASMT